MVPVRIFYVGNGSNSALSLENKPIVLKFVTNVYLLEVKVGKKKTKENTVKQKETKSILNVVVFKKQLKQPNVENVHFHNFHFTSEIDG